MCFIQVKLTKISYTGTLLIVKPAHSATSDFIDTVKPAHSATSDFIDTVIPAHSATSDFIDTVKPAHAATSVKQSPVLKDHLFLVLS